MNFRASTAALGLAIAFGAGALYAQDADEDPVIAVVNGTEIRMHEIGFAYQSLPEEYKQMPEQALFEPLLDQVVNRYLVVQAARAEGFDKIPEVSDQVNFVADSALRDSFLFRKIEEAQNPEALKVLYEAEVAKIPEGEEVSARHILVKTEEEAKAVKIRADAGEDFAGLASEISTGPSKVNGGDLGYFVKERMVPEFAETAFAMQPGQISDPVKTQFGWHVIKVEDRRAAQPPAMAEMEDQLKQQVARTTINDFLKELRDAAEIKITLPNPTDPAADTEGAAEPADKAPAAAE